MQNRHQTEVDANLYFFRRHFSLTRRRRSARAPNDWRRALRLRSFRFVTVSLNTNRFGGAERDRTADPLLAKQVLSQLSYSPSSSIAPIARPGFGNNPRQSSRSFPGHHSQMQMVGPGRLELPTPRLSSVCSNQLSYGPIREPVQHQLNKRGFLSS
jgi:hypothetical protein